MKRRLKINGIIIFCAFWLAVAFPGIFFRKGAAESFNTSLTLFGITFILFGQILRASSRGFKSENSKNGSSLIKGGPYMVVRNPMYLGISLIGLGIVAMLFKWWVACIFLPIFLARYLILIFEEEKKLSELFSKDYQDYCKRTPLILPSLNTIMKRDVAEYLPLKLDWLKREIGSILTLLLLVFFLGLWRNIKNEGLSAYLKEIVMVIAVVLLFMGLAIYLNRRTKAIEKDVSNKGEVNL